MDIAVLDACVLFQAGVRDFLLSIAYQGAFFPAWSDEIQKEWSRNRITATPPYQRSEYAITGTIAAMTAAFPASCFHINPQHLEQLQQNCPEERFRKDAHVLAAALQAEASTIVTFNRRDFLPALLQRHAIKVETPDQFCCRLVQTRLSQMLAGMAMQRARLKAPSRTKDEYLDNLVALGFRRTVPLLAPHIPTP